MARLPDIPQQSWLADQIDQFEKKTASLLEATKFYLASRDMESQILSPDFPYSGGLDTLEEQERLLEEQERRRQEEEARRQEEERQRQQAEYEAELARQAAEQQAQAEQARLEAASSEASQYGIPSPADVYDDFMLNSRRPLSGTPDNESTAGLLNSVPDIVDPLAGDTGPAVPMEPSNVKTASDFDNFVDSLWSGAKSTVQSGIDAVSDWGIVKDVRDISDMYNTTQIVEQQAREARERAGLDPNLNYEDRLRRSQPQILEPGMTTAGLGDAYTPNPEYGPVAPELPEEQASKAVSRSFLAQELGTPQKIIGDIVDVLIGDPSQEVKHDPAGVLSSLGMEGGMTKGQIFASITPLKWLNLPQWLDVGRQLVETPYETGAGIAIIGALGQLLKTPTGRQLALTTIGGIAGGIDAAMNQRDWTGQGSGTADVAVESAAGAAAGFRSTKTLPGAARLIKDIATSETAADALRYMDQLVTKVGSDVMEGLQTRYPAIADVVQNGADDAIRTVSPRGWENVPSMGEGERRAREVAGLRAPYGAGAGAATGAVAGAVQGQESDSLLDRAARIGTGGLLGTTAGRLAAREGTVAAGKLVDSLIKRGAIGPEVFESHPPTADRVRALFSIAARDLADDEVVDLPGMASYLAKSNPDVRQEIPEFYQKQGITAGEVRRLTQQPDILNRVYNASTEIVVDAITGIRNRQARGQEMGADAATMTGLPHTWRYDIQKALHSPGEAPPVTWSVMGEAHRIDNPDITGMLRSAADALGMPTPAMYVINSSEVNAAASRAGQGANRKPVIMVTKGLLDLGLNKDEISALFMHELAHVAERTKSNAKYVVPPSVVDQMTDIPVAKLDPRVLRAIQARGWSYDPETGITGNVVRAQSKKGAGARATRGGPFFEPVSEEGTSSYISTSGQSQIGGNELIPRTPTRYRNPLIMERRIDDDEYSGAYDDAFRKLQIPSKESSWTVMTDASTSGKPVEWMAFDSREAALREIRDNPIDNANMWVVPTSEVRPYLTRDQIHFELQKLRDTFGDEGVESPARRKAVKDLVAKYGGDPSTVDEMVDLRPGQEESEYSIVENIIANNARKQGYDAAFLMEPSSDLDYLDDAMQNPEYAKAKNTFDDLYKRMEAMEQSPGWDRNDPGYVKIVMDVQRASDNLADITDRLKQENRPIEWTEILSAREDRNPVPPRFEDARYGYAPSDEFGWGDSVSNVDYDLRNYSGRPNYSVHPDIRLPEGVARSTIREADSTPGVPVDLKKLGALEQAYDNAKADRLEAEETLQRAYSDPDIPMRRISYLEANRETTQIMVERTEQALNDYLESTLEPGLRKSKGAEWQQFPGSQEMLTYTAPKEPRQLRYDTDFIEPEIPPPPDVQFGPATQTVPANLAAGIPGGYLGSLEEDEEDRPLSTLAGVALGTLFGPKKLHKVFRDNPDLLNTPGVQMFKNPAPDAKLTNPGFFEAAYQAIAPKLTDAYARLAQYQNDIASEFLKQTGTLIPSRALAAELKRLDSNRAAEMMINRSLKPALNTLQDMGIDEAKLNEQLQYYQNVDIAKHMGNYSNTGLMAEREFPGGVDAVESMRHIREFEDKFRAADPAAFKQYQQSLRQIWEFGRQLLDIKREAGLITADAYRGMREAYPRYVPTRIIKHINNDGFVAPGRSLSVTSNTIHALTRQGTDEPSMNVVSALIGDAYESHAYANKNKVFNALVAMWGEAMNLDPYIVGDRSASQRRVGELASLVRIYSARTGTDSKDWVPVTGFVDGTKVKLAVHKDLGDVTRFEAPASIPIMSGLTAAFRAGATARNPVFLTANAALDFISYTQREIARAGGPTPQAISMVLWNYARSLGENLLDPRVWKDISRHEYRGGSEQFLSQGGGYAGHTNRSGAVDNAWIWRNLPEGLESIPPEDWPASEKLRLFVQNHLRSWGMQPTSELDRERIRLTRGSSVPTGAGAVAGGLSSGYYAYQTDDPDAAIADRLKRAMGYMGAGMVAGGVAASAARGIPRGMILAESPGDIARILKDVILLKPVEAVGERVELIPRVAAMRNAESRYQQQLNALLKRKEEATTRRLPQGVLDNINEELDDLTTRMRVDATNAGRTTTIDFAKGGTWVKTLNQIIPFFNVGVQALVDVPRAIGENPKAYPVTALASSVIPMVLAEIHNNATEERARNYADVPQYIKDQGLVLMLDGEPPVDENGNPHPQFVHVRYRQLAPIAVLTREVMQRVFNADNKRPTEAQRRDALEAAIHGIATMSPVSVNNPSDATLSFVPPILDTSIQASFNKDTFRDRTIISNAGDQRASPLSKMLAKELGFTESQKHASWWEFVTRSVGSGYAGMWHGAAEALYPEDKRLDSPQKRPITGGLVGRVVKGTTGEMVEQARDKVISPESLKILEQHGVRWRPQPADNVVDNIPLTQREYARYQRMLNEALEETIRNYSTKPQWLADNPLGKQEAIQGQMNHKRELIRARLMKDIPIEERKRRYDLEAKRGNVQPRIRER